MKKFVLMGMIFGLAGVLWAAGANLSPDQAVQVLKETLQKEGYQCTVTMSDINENGVNDYVIGHDSGNKDKPVLELQAILTGAVGALEDEIAFKSDGVYLKSADKVYSSTAAKCKECAKLAGKDDVNDVQMEACVKGIWQEEK